MYKSDGNKDRYVNPPSLEGTGSLYMNNSWGKGLNFNELPIHGSLREQNNVHQKRWADAEADVSFMNSNFGGDPSQQSSQTRQKSRFSCQMIKTTIDAISGYQIENRKSYKVVSSTDLHNKAADQQNVVQKVIMNNSKVLDALSKAFEGCLSTGCTFIEPISYDIDDINFNVELHVWPTWAVTFDINGRRADASDWEFFTTTQYMSKSMAGHFYPDVYSKNINLSSGIISAEYNLSYKPPSETGMEPNLVQIVRVWLRETVDYSFWFDSKTKRILPIEREDLLDEEGYWEVRSKRVLGWRLCEYVGGVLVNTRVSPFGSTAPFIPVFWDFSPDVPTSDQRYCSLIRRIKDPNFLVDDLIQMNLDAMNARANGGYIYRLGSIDEKVLSSTDNVANIPLKEKDDKLDFIPLSIFPQENLLAIQQFSLFARQSAPVEFVAPEITKNDSGEKIALMQGIQVRGLASYISRLDTSLKDLGLLMCKTSNLYLSKEQAESMLGEELDPFFWQVGIRQQDFEACLGVFTDVQKQQVYLSAMNMFKEWGRPPSTEVMKMISTIPEKEAIFEQLEKEDKGQTEMMAKIKNLEEQQAQAQIEKTKAEAILSLHKTRETEARAKDILGLAQEHASRSEQSVASAVKSYAEAIKVIAETEALFGKEELNKLMTEVGNIHKQVEAQVPSLPVKELGSTKIEEAEGDIYDSNKNQRTGRRMDERGE